MANDVREADACMARRRCPVAATCEWGQRGRMAETWPEARVVWFWPLDPSPEGCEAYEERPRFGGGV